jgi:nitrogen fixation protein NifB
MLKIAVASNDGTTVDEHFGRAKIFRIYEVDDNGASLLLENREIKPLPPGSPEPSHSSDVTVEQLSDVNAVLAAQIGVNSQESLSNRGIRSFALKGSLEKAISSYGRRHKLLNANIPVILGGHGSGKGCNCSSRGGCK